MKTILHWFRPFLIPALLVVAAMALTVPWSLVVLRAAYERDVTDNAKALARRVEQNISMTVRSVLEHQSQLGNINPNDIIDQKMNETLRTEMRSDGTVQTVVFYVVKYNEALSPPVPDQVQFTAIVRSADNPVPKISRDDIEELARRGIVKSRDNFNYRFRIPWMQKGRVIGITYLELSAEALSRDFWQKEAALFWQVSAWTTSGVLALSAIGIFAWRTWRKAGRERQRAELAQQGMLAERGLTAAVLAHEIRNPLQALRFQLHSLRKNASDAQRVNATSETIDSELMRIQQLVTDYLEHERATSLRVQRVNLEEAARKLKSVMDELLRQHDTALTIIPPASGEVQVACDPHALRQILMNLTLNAQQAMGRGGSITIRVGRDEDFGTIDVSDTGPGIPAEMRERLFKPFQTSKAEGHGIGLALVKRFVDNFGGNVSVESEAGRGTTFRLRLPLAEHAHSHEDGLGSDSGGVDGPSDAGYQKAIPMTK